MDTSILNVFPGQSDDDRLVLAREISDDNLAHLVLRQETRSPHVGWFVQSRIVIEPAQDAAVKMTLTSNLVKETVVVDEKPSVLRFQSAMAG